MMRGRSEQRRSGGFTLIEVMLTIALIALLGSMFVINIGSLLKDTQIRSLENEYWRAVDSARSNAVYKQKPFLVEWLPKEMAFVVTSSGESERFALDASEFADVPIEVLFEEIAPENGYVLIRGELVAKREVATVTFFPDGTCTPYSVALKIGEYRTAFRMDPWTGAQLVETSDDEA